LERVTHSVPGAPDVNLERAHARAALQEAHTSSNNNPLAVALASASLLRHPSHDRDRDRDREPYLSRKFILRTSEIVRD